MHMPKSVQNLGKFSVFVEIKRVDKHDPNFQCLDLFISFVVKDFKTIIKGIFIDVPSLEEKAKNS